MSNREVLLDRARLLLEQGRHRDAESNIMQALQQDPEDDNALSLLARCYYGKKQFDEGIETIMRAIAIEPENGFYFYLLGFGYYQKNHASGAIENLNKAIQLNPYYAEFYGLLAFVLLEEKDFEKALQKSDEGLAIDPENVTCLNARSTALNKLRRTDAAIETMQNALAQDPENEFTHTVVGWNFLEKGRHREAGKHFREALRIDPNYYNARHGLKESLKSRIPLYRWLLQYSFWVNNKGKNIHAFLPIALYLLFRLLIGLSGAYKSTAGLAWILVAFYLVIVVTSWTINSIANFMLLFHADGKYALSSSERWSSILAVCAMVIGLTVLAFAQFSAVATGTAYEGNLFFAGLLALSLALPFSNLNFPIQLKGKGWREWYTVLLSALGLLILLLFVLAPAVTQGLFILYGISFIIYNWSGLAK